MAIMSAGGDPFAHQLARARKLSERLQRGQQINQYTDDRPNNVLSGQARKKMREAARKYRPGRLLDRVRAAERLL